MPLLEEGNGDLPLFGALFHRLITRLRRLAGVDAPPPWLPTRALSLQRGSRENYAANDYRVHALLNGLVEEPELPTLRVPLEALAYEYGERCNKRLVDLQGSGMSSVAEAVAVLEEAYRAEAWPGPEQCAFSEDAAAELCRTGRLKTNLAWGVACQSTFPEDGT